MCPVSSGNAASCQLTGPAPYRLLLRGSSLDDSGYRVAARRMNSPIGCTAIDSIAVGISDRRGQLPETDSIACYRFNGAAADQLEASRQQPRLPGRHPVHERGRSGRQHDLLGVRDRHLHAARRAVRTPCWCRARSPGAYVLGATCLNPACGSDVFTVSSTSPRSAGKPGR